MCICVCVRNTEREQFTRFSFLLPPCGSLRLSGLATGSFTCSAILQPETRKVRSQDAGWWGSGVGLVEVHVDRCLLHPGHFNWGRGTLDYVKVGCGTLRFTYGWQPGTPGEPMILGITMWSPSLPISYCSLGCGFSAEANLKNWMGGC